MFQPPKQCGLLAKGMFVKTAQAHLAAWLTTGAKGDAKKSPMAILWRAYDWWDVTSFRPMREKQLSSDDAIGRFLSSLTTREHNIR